MSSDNNSARDEQWPFLSPEHAKLLQDSGISSDIARGRGYRTEGTKSQVLSPLEFSQSGRTTDRKPIVTVTLNVSEIAYDAYVNARHVAK